jgi:hypothetical protein
MIYPAMPPTAKPIISKIIAIKHGIIRNPEGITMVT